MRLADDFARLPGHRLGLAGATRTGSRQLAIWDGTRPLTPRDFQSRTSLNAGGAEFVFATEQIATPTDWYLREPRHIIVVHRRGQLRTMEVEFENGLSGRADPQVGDVWIIPAHRRYSALAQGSTVGYCQLTLPPGFLGDVDLKPTIGQRDPLTHRITEQIGVAAGREDVFARLSTEWLTETLLRHLSNKLTQDNARTPGLYRDFGETVRAALIKYLDESPDSMIGLPELAEYVGMTVPEFTRAFAAAFHTAPHQLLLDRRITKAKRLLLHSAAPIAEISAQLGFYGTDHLETAFTRRVGIAPSAYRQQRRARPS